MNVINALCLLLLFSCTKYASVTRDSVGTLVQDVEMEIYQLNDVDWFVGKKKEHKITQSITFYVTMPKVSEDDLRFLTEQKAIDSWIVRLILVRAGKTQDLGSLYTLFQPISKGRRSTVPAGPATSVTVKIYYAAAYASERFRAFRCPAFRHDKRISSMSLSGENTPFEIAIQGGVPYLEKSQLIELTPSSFNGGHTLVGEYFLEIAPYSTKTKQIFSAFKRLPMSVQVKEEEAVTIASCAGEHPEIEQ